MILMRRLQRVAQTVQVHRAVGVADRGGGKSLAADQDGLEQQSGVSVSFEQCPQNGAEVGEVTRPVGMLGWDVRDALASDVHRLGQQRQIPALLE